MKHIISVGLLLTSLCLNLSAQHILSPLPYAYDALEPFFDKQTMEIHHDKHHAAYVNNLNTAIKGTDLEKLTLNQLMYSISKYSPLIRNNAGGHFNHTMFWEILIAHENSSTPSTKLQAAIIKEFGSMEKFKELFSESATKKFGSGWVWLVIQSDNKLVITSTSNQDNPLMDIAEIKGVPILCLDIWEHAYYLKYQNKRADYIKSFWEIVNWNEVSTRFEGGVK